MNDLLRHAVTGTTRAAALEQVAQAILNTFDDDLNQHKETDMTNSPDFGPNTDPQNSEPNAAKPAPRNDGLTATGRDIQRHPNSMGQPAKGALSGGNMPTLSK